jgi:hypothetical protein
VNTLRRWSAVGLQGGKVRLRVARIGGQVCTCDRWIREFLNQLNQSELLANEVQIPRNLRERERASASAQEELARQWSQKGSN